MLKSCSIVIFGLVLTSCAGAPRLPSGTSAYGVIPAALPDGEMRSYRIGPLDTISVTVFQEPDLSVRGLQVDAAGKVIVPLVGEIEAGGKTSTQLAQEIAQQFGRFLERPQIAVTVQDSVSQKVTVEGGVIESGVYQIRGKTTLLDAIAMAKGLTRAAARDQVAIFRVTDRQRVGALFDIGKINHGEAPDPEILGSDVVVVGISNIKQAWLDVLQASPLIAAVRP